MWRNKTSARPFVAALALLALLLSSCATPNGDPRSTTAAALDADSPETKSATLSTGVWQPGIAAVRARPTLKPAFIANPDPTALIGLERADVAALLGPPKLLRRDPPAELWQYLSEACVLHVFMYTSNDLPGYRVRHVEVRDRRTDVAAPSCYAQLINAPMSAPEAG